MYRVRTERVQKSNSAFMDTDEPIICWGLDRTAACAVGHSLSKHEENALPLCVNVCVCVCMSEKEKGEFFSFSADHRILTASETEQQF